jgi:hypothetical protein
MGACRFYRSYLDAAHQVDAWIKEIWDFVQNDPQYKDKTALVLLLITVVVKQNGRVMEISLKDLQEYGLQLWDQN